MILILRFALGLASINIMSMLETPLQKRFLYTVFIYWMSEDLSIKLMPPSEAFWHYSTFICVPLWNPISTIY